MASIEKGQRAAIEKVRQVKTRMAGRCYRDAQAADIATFLGATSRWGQRLVVIIAVQARWDLFSLDVSQAFLRGMPRSELAKLDGEISRDVTLNSGTWDHDFAPEAPQLCRLRRPQRGPGYVPGPVSEVGRAVVDHDEVKILDLQLY